MLQFYESISHSKLKFFNDWDQFANGESVLKSDIFTFYLQILANSRYKTIVKYECEKCENIDMLSILSLCSSLESETCRTPKYYYDE